MLQGGALVTEFRHDEKPDAPNFVKRNRIIAGLADATIVVESGEQGGALITADIANSYNRDVFAFPGRVNDRYSTGCNRLIKTNRAAMIEKLEDLEYLMGWQRSEEKKPTLQKTLFVELDADERLLIDYLALKSNLPVSKVSAMLLSLEFKGIVKCLPGKVYQKT